MHAIKSRPLRLTRCPRCQYDLTGNETKTCPECGQDVSLVWDASIPEGHCQQCRYRLPLFDKGPICRHCLGGFGPTQAPFWVLVAWPAPVGVLVLLLIATVQPSSLGVLILVVPLIGLGVWTASRAAGNLDLPGDKPGRLPSLALKTILCLLLQLLSVILGAGTVILLIVLSR